EAIPMIERAMRLDPAHSEQYLHFLGMAYLLAGKYETAASHFRERIRLVPRTDFSRAPLASALGHLGEIDEARRIWHDLWRSIRNTHSASISAGYRSSDKKMSRGSSTVLPRPDCRTEPTAGARHFRSCPCGANLCKLS